MTPLNNRPCHNNHAYLDEFYVSLPLRRWCFLCGDWEAATW